MRVEWETLQPKTHFKRIGLKTALRVRIILVWIQILIYIRIRMWIREAQTLTDPDP
jgi:hypothetical protein